MMTRKVLGTTAIVALLLGTTNGIATAAPVYGSAGAGDAYYPEDGNGGYQVDDYDISIDYDPASHQLKGVAKISATTTQALKGFNLDLLGFTVDSVRVDSRDASHRRESAHELVVRPAGSLRKGQKFTVEVAYHGVPDPAGAWFLRPSGGAYAVGERQAASSWFPVNETPRDKATFTLRATVPAGWSVLSNGVRENVLNTAGKTTYTWRERTPITGYLTTIAIDRFTLLTQRRSNGMPLVSAFAPGTEGNIPVEKRLPEILDFEESLFGAYPIDTGGGVYEFGPFTGALEAQGRSVYIIAQGSGTVANARNLVHENAHQWWGDSVSLWNWSDLCLKECVAAYTEDLWSAQKEGLDLDRNYRETVSKNLTNPTFWSAKLHDGGPDSEMANAVYYRGPLFMHALRRQVGDRAFFAALKAFPQAHRDSNATLQQFIASMECYSAQDLSAFTRAWLDSTTIPADRYLWPGNLKP
ncbi:peptidase M1-like protein [Actinocrispum wychmicini]|uniref:Aminopeptidase N n=2 Tax=Actinocrispum wychmicini TaxID=1213861 RepID=A0A4R2JBM9_9PSEU|nr:peptidase M1-like protein [Actinocrispum wychmicini]